METIQKVASAASKSIWGEQTATQQNETGGKEPISGETGKGTPNEPYDQGNSDDATAAQNTNTFTEPKDTSTSNTEPKDTPEAFKKTDTFTTVDKDTPSDTTDKNLSTTKTGDKPSTTMSSQPTTNAPINPNNAAAGGDVDPHRSTEKTGVTSHTGNPPKTDIIDPTERSSNPGAAPASGAAPFAKQQGADKPTDAPSDDQIGAISSKTDDAEEILKKRDPSDHSGEPMHMHDGSEKKVPDTQEERRTSVVGNPGGQEHGKPPKGTGEQYVKSTGVAAEGGDFDATKPGAGREAYRLLEEKGIKKDTTAAGTDTSATTSTTHDSHDAHAGGDKEKTKLSEKIKEKLHIGHKH